MVELVPDLAVALGGGLQVLARELARLLPQLLGHRRASSVLLSTTADGGGGFRVWISFSTPGPLTLSGPGSRACSHVPGPARSVAHMVDGPWALPDLGSSFSFVLGGATRLGFPWALLSSAQAQHRRRCRWLGATGAGDRPAMLPLVDADADADADAAGQRTTRSDLHVKLTGKGRKCFFPPTENVMGKKLVAGN